MPRVYQDVDSLQNSAIIGSGSCVLLVQRYVSVGHTSTWREGAQVRGNHSIRKGTAIATFVNGRYPNLPTGNHAAFYISQDSGGMWIMEQFREPLHNPNTGLLRFVCNDGIG